MSRTEQVARERRFFKSVFLYLAEEDALRFDAIVPQRARASVIAAGGVEDGRWISGAVNAATVQALVDARPTQMEIANRDGEIVGVLSSWRGVGIRLSPERQALLRARLLEQPAEFGMDIAPQPRGIALGRAYLMRGASYLQFAVAVLIAIAVGEGIADGIWTYVVGAIALFVAIAAFTLLGRYWERRS
jgi:hypothetical protein